MNANNIDRRAQVIGAVTMDLDQLGHAGPTSGNGARHDLDDFVGLDRRKPGYSRLLDMKFQRFIASAFAQLRRPPILGDRNVRIVQIACVKNHTLRVGLGPTNAKPVMEGEIRFGQNSNSFRLAWGVDAHRLEVAFHITGGLSKAVFVFDHSNADKAFAIFAVSNTGCDSDLGVR